MSDNVSGGGVSGQEFRDFKAEMSEFVSEMREFRAEVNRKFDAILDILQAHVTGTANRFDALEGRLERVDGRLERVEDHLGIKEPVR